jgi:hypothetical protein
MKKLLSLFFKHKIRLSCNGGPFICLSISFLFLFFRPMQKNILQNRQARIMRPKSLHRSGHHKSRQQIAASVVIAYETPYAFTNHSILCMKPLLLILCLCALCTPEANTQDLKLPKQSLPAAANAGNLISQFANALKPSSFTAAFKGEKSGWLAKAATVSDAVSTANTVSSPACFIKRGLFNQGESVQSILLCLPVAKSPSSAAGFLKTLEGGLKPEAFISGWAAQRSGWPSALILLI